MPKRIRTRNQGQSEIRVANLRKVFRSDFPSQFDYILASLSVLYEDLRLELSACSQKKSSRLDILDPIDVRVKDRPAAYRRHYFLRRSIASLRDFAEGLRLINECGELNALRRSFSPEAEKLWGDAVVFFKTNELLIKKVRNDIGGHFGIDAGGYSVRIWIEM
jgi:hypothetical protein